MNRSPLPRARAAVAAVAAFAIILPAMAAASAAAGTRPDGAKSGEVGSPQPELDTFKVAPAGTSGGSGAVLPNGTMVLAWVSNGGKGAFVCTLPAGARKCATTVTLKPSSGDDFFGSAAVFALGGASVSIALYDCCRIGPDGIVVFRSTDGGITFTGLEQAGSLPGLTTGVNIGNSLVLSPSVNSAGLQIQAVPAHPSAPETSIANPDPGDVDTSLTSYKSGVLAAYDTLAKTYTAAVQYAAKGANFNATSAYHKVGSFSDEQMAWASGTALLTLPGAGGARLRFFDGKGYGAAHKVPEPSHPDDGQFTVAQAGGVSHVFFVDARHGYDVMTETTSDGAHWSSLQTLHTFIDESQSAPVLGPSGSGILLGTSPGAGQPALAQPVLNTQHVTLKLASTHVPKGKTTTASGTATPALTGQTVTLQWLSSGRWHNLSTAKEKAGGVFSFTVPSTTRTYRAVVAYKPGFYQYGYSSTVKVTQT